MGINTANPHFQDSISLASAASIESIRLSSPRSADSVFYSPEHHSCHHCGKQIDSQTPDTNFCQVLIFPLSIRIQFVFPKPPLLSVDLGLNFYSSEKLKVLNCGASKDDLQKITS